MFIVVCTELHYAIGPIKNEATALKLALEMSALNSPCKYGVVPVVVYAEDRKEGRRGYL